MSMKGKGKDKGKAKDKGKGKGKILGMIEEKGYDDLENEYKSGWTVEVLMMINGLENVDQQQKDEETLFIVDCGAEVHALPYYIALYYGAVIVQSRARH